jgi:hypothetical protein
MNVGAIAFTPQFIGTTVFATNRGITKLTATQVYGNFMDSIMSINYTSLYNTKKNQISCSCVSRDKSLYMLFCNDGSALFSTIVNGKLLGTMEQLFPIKVTCVCSADDASGNEIIMVGADDGMVYQLFSGVNFDGAALSWYCDFVYDYVASPTFIKRFMAGHLDLSGSGYSTFNFGYSIEYGDVNTPQPSLEGRIISRDPEYWDLFTWDSFTWDGALLTPERFDIMGFGTNIAFRLSGSSSYSSPLLFSGALLQYYVTRSI